MQKVNFIKTSIPESQYKQKYSLGNTIVYHIGTTFNNEQNTYECYECTVPASTFDEDMVKSSFSEFIAKINAMQLKQAKADKIAEITAYDTSDKVNGFVLNGLLVWLDKATRVGLMNSTTIAKAAGQKTTTLWLEDIKLEVDCDKAIQLLSALEMYALKCFNVTAAHKAAVSELKTVKEVEAFDVTADYPKQLEMKL